MIAGYRAVPLFRPPLLQVYRSTLLAGADSATGTRKNSLLLTRGGGVQRSDVFRVVCGGGARVLVREERTRECASTHSLGPGRGMYEVPTFAEVGFSGVRLRSSEVRIQGCRSISVQIEQIFFVADALSLGA